jgi:hypothetical protein
MKKHKKSIYELVKAHGRVYYYKTIRVTFVKEHRTERRMNGGITPEYTDNPLPTKLERKTSKRTKTSDNKG